jgi:hypothetical protein
MSYEPHSSEDLEWIRSDDLLLDALGRGEATPGDDEVAAMLAAWRADIADELPTVRAAAPVVTALDDDAPDQPTVPIEPAAPTAYPEWTTQPIPIAPVRARRRLPRPRAVAVAAAFALIAALGGASVAALNATPGSPLWPISQVLDPNRADVLNAQQAIDKLRAAVNAQRYDEATRLVPPAQALVDKVHDGQQRQRLQAQLDALVRALAAQVAPPSAPGAPSVPTGPTVAPTPAPSQAPVPGGGNGGPANSPTKHGGVLPPLRSLVPSLPLPPLPLPSLPLPLPSLPIHLP